VLYALKPVVISIVVQAIWKLGRTAIKTVWLAFIAVTAMVLYSLHVHELLTLAIAAALALTPTYRSLRRVNAVSSLLMIPIRTTGVFVFSGAAAPHSDCGDCSWYLRRSAPYSLAADMSAGFPSGRPGGPPALADRASTIGLMRIELAIASSPNRDSQQAQLLRRVLL
jgi:hypothetical protein